GVEEWRPSIDLKRLRLGKRLESSQNGSTPRPVVPNLPGTSDCVTKSKERASPWFQTLQKVSNETAMQSSFNFFPMPRDRQAKSKPSSILPLICVTSHRKNSMIFSLWLQKQAG